MEKGGDGSEPKNSPEDSVTPYLSLKETFWIFFFGVILAVTLAHLMIGAVLDVFGR